jgi:probable F420-dependent oxidoreductase
MVVSLGQSGDVVHEVDRRWEVVELEYFLNLVALAFPVPQLIQPLLYFFVFEKLGHLPPPSDRPHVLWPQDTALLPGRKPLAIVRRYMRYGIGIGGPMTLIGPMARMVEDAGFESCWAAETTNTAFVTASVAIQSTSRIKVGTAVALAFPRSPTITAMTAWDLDELSGGRFLLGLGTQVKRVNEHRFSVPFEHPAPKLREYAQVLRTVWEANRGEDVVHRGRFYTVTMPTFHAQPQPDRRDVPIYLAAVGPVMARTCGEIADGLIGHPFASPKYLAEVVRPAIEAGAELAGRKPEECNLTASPLISISDDVDRARREVKLQIAFYATTRTYLPILELHGRAHIIGELRSAFGGRDARRMVELIDDELCDAIAIAGPQDEVRERVREWERVADRLMVAGPWYGPDSGRMMENYQALVETFGGLSE